MNRIDKKFKELKAKKKKAFLAYLTAGDPDLTTTERLVLELEKAGADIIELGIPFSDPMADGPTIQAASQRALDKGVTLEKIFKLVQRIRQKSEIPLCLMTYFNPVFHYGEARFVQRSKQAGVDGLIIPDLPPEEAGTLIPAARKAGIATVFFLAPTTVRGRIKKISKVSTGFIYYVSLTGVTGARRELPADILQNIRAAKKMTDKPICVGFGVSSPEQVRSITRVADGVIVGSAIIKELEKNKGRQTAVAKAAQFVRRLTRVLEVR